MSDDEPRARITDSPLYPDVVVQLTGTNGNAFNLIAAVRAALRDAGLSRAAEDFVLEATSGDYNHLLATCMRWVDVQ